MTLETAIDEDRKMGKLALYFGCWDQPGHYLHGPGGANAFWYAFYWWGRYAGSL